MQSLEGGIVQEMLVSAGQKVKKGQLRFGWTRPSTPAGLGENRQRYLAALAGRARTDALLNGGAPKFDPAWRTEAPDLIEKETQLWRDALREYNAGIEAAREGTARHSGELREAQARMQSLAPSVKVAEESFAIEERLFKEGAGARADYLAAQQKLLAQKAELDALRQSIPAAQGRTGRSRRNGHAGLVAIACAVGFRALRVRNQGHQPGLDARGP